MSALAKPNIDLEFIEPFVKATQLAFLTQASTPVVAGEPYVKQDGAVIKMEIAGVISLCNRDLTGSISLCFEGEVFLKIYENMVGEKHTKISPEIEDAAGELLNIIFGQAKTILNDQKGYHLERAIPTILVGDNLRLRYSSNSPVVLLPFESSVGNFHVAVVIERS